MKVGFQTILWGPRPGNLLSVFDALAEAGFQGVEFAQRPEVLGDVVSLGTALQERRLTCLGLAGGTLEERMDFCGDFRPQYLYIENWHTVACPLALSRGFTLSCPSSFTFTRSKAQASR